VITVRYRVLYPSVTLWPLTRTERRAISTASRCRPMLTSVGQTGTAPGIPGRPGWGDPQVKGGFSRAGEWIGYDVRVSASVAQQAEQPSCKQLDYSHPVGS
jgi:hypothetical protein